MPRLRAAASPPLLRFGETRRVRPTSGVSPECAEGTHGGYRLVCGGEGQIG